MTTSRLFSLVAACAVLAAPPLDAQRWTVAATPTFSLSGTGRAGGEFGVLLDAFRLGNGTTVVIDATALRVHFVSAAGKLLASVGGKGSGPGEFQTISWAQRGAADSVWVWDWVQRRFAVFTPAGQFATIRAFPNVRAGAGSVVPRAIFPDGSFLSTMAIGQRFPFPGNEGDVMRDTTVFLRVSSQGQVLWKGGQLPDRTTFGMAYVRGTKKYLGGPDLPFGPLLSWSLLGDSLVYGTGERFALSVVGANGQVARTITVNRSPAPLGRAYADTAARAIQAAWEANTQTATASLDSTILSLLKNGKIPLPAMLPAYDRVLVDPTGFLWLQAPNPAGLRQSGGTETPGSPEWLVIDRAGREVQRIRLPAGLRVTEVGADYVIGVHADEEGTQELRYYRLQR